jgi:hypothetical protein
MAAVIVSDEQVEILSQLGWDCRPVGTIEAIES